jgi:hypothetical protein
LPPSWSARRGFQGRVDREDRALPRNGPDAAKENFETPQSGGVRHAAGRTLKEGIEIWKAANKVPRGKTIIAPQFEYNRHIRDFFRANPGKSLRDAIAAWRTKKSVRRAD